MALVVILFFLVSASVEAQSRPELSDADQFAIVSAVESVCPLMVDEAVLVKAIQEERANPTGVVNLRTLHRYGRALQGVRADLRIARKRNARGIVVFGRWAGKPLDLGFCSVHEQQKEAEAVERDSEAMFM